MCLLIMRELVFSNPGIIADDLIAGALSKAWHKRLR